MQILFRENEMHLFTTEDELWAICGIWDLLISSYNVLTGEPSSEFTTIYFQRMSFDKPPYPTLIFPAFDYVNHLDFASRIE